MQKNCGVRFPGVFSNKREFQPFLPAVKRDKWLSAKTTTSAKKTQKHLAAASFKLQNTRSENQNHIL